MGTKSAAKQRPLLSLTFRSAGAVVLSFQVHEADAGKGGLPLDQIKRDCASRGDELVKSVFDGRVVIQW
eukprot:6175609-Pleurochrysis_carterae.AAC.4